MEIEYEQKGFNYFIAKSYVLQELGVKRGGTDMSDKQLLLERAVQYQHVLLQAVNAYY